MRILLAHNYYQQPGGEDGCFAEEAALLEERGHHVLRYTMHNNQIRAMSSLEVAGKTLWNRTAYRELRRLIRREKPQVAHFHNTFPLISPAAYHAAQAEGVPVIQTLHNYRLACLNGNFFRDGQVCEDCLGKSLPSPGVIHACYRSSHAASSVVAALLASHRALGTWTRCVNRFIALSAFARDKLVQTGLPREKVALKPNFLPHPPPPGNGDGNYALFVGRLSPEKGLHTLIDAWRKLEGRFDLTIVGDGPLASTVAKASAAVPGITWLGLQPPEQVYALMGAARMLLIPSECYETFGRVGMEALAAGTPLIASKIGAVAELVEPGVTGLHVQPGDPEDLAARVTWTLDHPAAWTNMRQNARAAFEANYTADRNYEMLMQIYEDAINSMSPKNAAQV